MPTLPSSETSAFTLGARRAAILAVISALALTAVTVRAAPWSADQGSAPQAPATPPPAAQTAKPGELGYEDTPTIPGQTWRVHDVNRPAPPLVVPGATPGAAPSDAIVLFDGKDLSKWAQRGPNGEIDRTEMAGARRLLRDRRQERLDVHARQLRRRAAAHRMGDALGGRRAPARGAATAA